MGYRFLGLLRKEFIQFFRDRIILILVLWLYTIEVIICSYALSFEVRDMPMVVADEDGTVASRSLARRFSLTETFRVNDVMRTAATAAENLEKGEAGIVLIIPAGFQQRLASGLGPEVQLLIDGTNSNTAATVRHYALAIINRFEHESATALHAASAEPLIRTWYNPSQETVTFMVLSMIALAGMMVGMLHPAASIVREKEQGTIEQLLVTSISTAELFLAKILPTIFIGLLSIFPSLLIVEMFQVPFRGSLPLFLLMTGIFLLSAISLGVLIAAFSRTLQQALLLSFFGLFPIMFLSGSLTPVESMPPFLQALSMASPLRHYMNIILGIFLKGAGWRELWQETALLFGMGILLLSFSAAVFRRNIV